MAFIDIDSLRQRFRDNYKTKSSNNHVIAVYKVILEHENSDSDYWNEEHGAQDIIGVFKSGFGPYDWEALEIDLHNWTDFQLELFTQAIMGGYLAYTNNGVYYADKEIVDTLTQTIPNRFDVLFSAIRIGKERPLTYGNLTYQVYQNLDFITDHFEILLEADQGYLNKVKELLELLNFSEPTGENILALKAKIEKAGG